VASGLLRRRVDWADWLRRGGTGEVTAWAERILDAASSLPPAAARSAGGGGLELSILLTDDRGIRPLHALWRGRDRPTDVLSFALGEGEGAHIHPEVLGDAVVSVETAARQAPVHGLDLAEEVAFLLVHAVLHLLGFDHEDEAGRKEMEAQEQHVWERAGGSGRLR